MKKHKSVVAILLAVMMIFTMMPMMAFATTTQTVGDKSYEWADDFSTVTIAGTTYKATRSVAGDAWTGVVEARINLDGKSESIVNMYSDAVIRYYDLDNAETRVGTSKIYDTYTQDDFAKVFDAEAKAWKAAAKVYFAVPSYVEDYATAWKTTEAVTSTEFDGQWAAELSKPESYTADSTADQKFTLTTKLSTETENKLYSKGSIPVKDVTVKGIVVTPQKANFYFDSTDGNKFTADVNKTYYDGEAHTVVADAVPGWTVSYSVFNNTTGKYDAVSAVSLTDVQKDPVQFKATFKQTGKTDVERTFKVNLAAGNGAEFTFDQDASITDAGFNYSVPGTEYTAADYVTVAAKEVAVGADDVDGKAKAAATAKAVKANEALLKQYFNDYFEIVAKESKQNKEIIKLNVNEKDLTTAEGKALKEKYAALLLNMGTPDGAKAVAQEAKVYLNGGVYDYEVEFTKAPAGAKVYKANKKGKLAKNKTFSVKAVANDGNEVFYKLINANSNIKIDKKTGKITVKKGLKKGTYKFTVKAYVPGVAGNTKSAGEVSGWYEYQTVKVKIKK